MMEETMTFGVGGICGMGLSFALDGFRLIYFAVAVVMWAVSFVLSLEYMEHYKNRLRYYVFFWITFFATAGVFLSADLYTTFIFFEIMSIASYVWVAFDERPESLKAAQTYLAVSVIGGLTMLMGLFILHDIFGTLDMETVAKAAANVISAGGSDRTRLHAAALCMLFGFGAKAGCMPLHIWLPKAHPVAPAPASALLSGILTKAGIFGIVFVSCRMMPAFEGWGELVLALGLITMFWGAVLAVFSVNLKRTLACSSVSQIGFILTGIGVGTIQLRLGTEAAKALQGAFMHMLNHSVFKLVLFLCAGVVFMNLHKLEFNDIRGYGRKKPLLMALYLAGALGIGGMPLFSGYVSKTLLHEGLVECYAHTGDMAFKAAEYLFLFSGGMTVAYMLKIFFMLFVEKNADAAVQAGFEEKKSYMRPQSAAAIALPAAVILVFGCLPGRTMTALAALAAPFFGLEPEQLHVEFFSLECLSGACISIVIGILLYVFFVRRCLMKDGAYVNRFPQALDLEELVYRPLLLKVLPGVFTILSRIPDGFTDSLVFLCRRTTHSQHPSAAARVRGKKRAALDDMFAALSKGAADTGMIVEESFSFGLILAVIGLCLMLFYMTFVYIRR